MQSDKESILAEIRRPYGDRPWHRPFFLVATRWLAFLTLWGALFETMGLLGSTFGWGFEAQIKFGQPVIDGSTDDGFSLILLLVFWSTALAFGILWRDRQLISSHIRVI